MTVFGDPSGSTISGIEGLTEGDGRECAGMVGIGGSASLGILRPRLCVRDATRFGGLGDRVTGASDKSG